MADFKNKNYQALISWFAWFDRKDRNARGKRRAWVKAEMKEAARKIRRNNKKIEKIPSGAFAERIYRQQYDDSLI